MIQPTKKQRPRNKRFSPLHCGSKEQLVVPLQTDRDHCPLRATNNKGDVPKPPTGNPGGSSQALQLGCVGKRAIFSSALVCERRHLHSGRHICRGVWAFPRKFVLGTIEHHRRFRHLGRPGPVSDLPSHFTNAAGANGELFVYDDPNIDARAANTEVPNGINELLLEFTPSPALFSSGS